MTTRPRIELDQIAVGLVLAEIRGELHELESAETYADMGRLVAGLDGEDLAELLEILSGFAGALALIVCEATGQDPETFVQGLALVVAAEGFGEEEK